MKSLMQALLTVVGCGALASPALAQHVRLEEAWAVCARVAGSASPEATLASSATSAGFPLLQQSFHGLRDGQGQVVVLSIDRPLAGVAQCVVRHNGGEEADLAARAARFWEARGYTAFPNRAATYSGVESVRFTSAALRAESPDFWATSVEWDD
jgi:hypothetical protein